MSRRCIYVIVAAVVLFVAGCASGPIYSSVEKTLPTFAREQGRIYFYRLGGLFGAAIQPSIQMNREVVGSAVPGGVFFRDVSPGNYIIATSTEVDRELSFTLTAGQERYVRLITSLGVLIHRVSPELVDPSVGKVEIQGLSYTGGGETQK